jgi:hypothetical protein
VRELQLRDGKVAYDRTTRWDDAGRPLEMSDPPIVFRYREHGELVQRDGGSSTSKLTWKGRFFNAPLPTRRAWMPGWNPYDPPDLLGDVGVGFEGEMTLEYADGRVERYFYDEHGKLQRTVKRGVERRYTWNEHGQHVKTEWIEAGVRVEIVGRYEDGVLVDASVLRDGVEVLGTHQDGRGRPTEERSRGLVIQRSTWTDGCER